jgi:thioredoxin-related protein
MNLKISFFLLFYATIFSAFSQIPEDSIKWISIEKAGELFTQTQRPIMIYLYKEGNSECEKMTKTTFCNSEVSNYINILFYPVKIEIETKDSLKFFDGKIHINSGKNGKIHDIATMFIGNNDSLPAIVLFDRRAKGGVFFGVKNRDEIFRHLIYYAEDMDLSLDFKDWYKIHEKGYPAGQEQIITRLIIKWKDLDEALELNKNYPKKMLINFYNYYKVSCTLIRTQSFNEPVIAKYLNDKYYPVNIDVFTQDTIKIFGQTYINENKPYKYHQLPIAALEGQMIFPSFLILDENGKVLQKIYQFMTPEKLEPIFKYYGDDAYKIMTFEQFVKDFKSEIVP